MSLEIDLRIKSNELLLQTLPLLTHEVILAKMLKQRLVIEVILRLTTPQTITDKAPLMLIPTMNIQLIIPIEPHPTERT
jgi:hypothetical protein